MSKLHYTLRGTVAVCGANQGMRLRSHLQMTTSEAEVTCGRCRKYLQKPHLSAEELTALLARMHTQRG